MVLQSEIQGLTNFRSDRAPVTAAVGQEANDFIEQILLWIQTFVPQEEIVQAREEFFQLTGKVFPDDPFYDQRMAYFLDYFVFDRRLPTAYRKHLVHTVVDASTSITPFDFYKAISHRDGKRGKFDDLLGVRHSLFMVRKLSSHDAVFLDLLNNSEIEAHSDHSQGFRWLIKKDIIQAHMYIRTSGNTVSDGVIYHNKTVRAIVRKIAKQFIAGRTPVRDELEILLRFANLNMKKIRLRTSDPVSIYSAILKP